MKNFSAKTLLVAVSVLLGTTALLAQVQTGTPKFGSFGGGQFDTVNLGNLNVHFTVPVLHKAGRGIPFSFDLGYDSSIYQIATVNGSQTWQPSSQAGSYGSYWGWQNLALYIPYVNFTSTVTSSGTCYNNQQWYVVGYSNYVYYDEFGTGHPFPGVGGAQMFSPGGTGCPPPYTSGQTTGTAGDDSGYSISFGVVGSSSGTVSTSSGTNRSVPLLTSPPVGSNPYNATDANGNKITFSSGTFTDTLGTTALTVTGAEPNPVKFTYTGPAGSEFYQVNFTSYNIKTAFLCTSPTIQDYTSTGSVYLPSSIVLPDGSQYSFLYESTPGHSGYTTGRVSQVTLPTGGTISYSYTFSGSNDGINCSDGSTMYVQRSLSPGGVWQYSRSGSGTAWTTTVNDPASNQTAINFEEYNNNFYETQRLSYSGSTTSGTLLSTAINCYNGQSVSTPASCYNTAITAQITEITNFRYLPNSSGLQAKTDTTYDTFGLVGTVKEYDYGSGAVGSLIRQTVTNYTAGLGNGIADRPSTVAIEDSGNNIKAYTSYGYDETAVATPSGTTPQWVSVSGSRGNLTSVIAQASGSINLYRKYTYYNTGTFNTSTDVDTSSATTCANKPSICTTYNYNNTGNADCGNAFVTSISEPVASMSRSFVWDCNGGVLLSVTDENGNTSSTAYSGSNYANVFWRPYSTTDEASTATDYFYDLTTATPPVEFQTESKYHTTFNSGNSIVDKVTTNDGMGNAIFSQTKQGPSATNYDTVATCYDSFGRVSQTTLPYSAVIATSTSTCPSTNPGKLYAYDALGRTSTVSDNYTGGGSTSYTYTENDTLQTGTSPTVSKQSETDALGRLKSVCEITSGTTAWPGASCSQNTSATGYLTSYAYDVLGNRTSVTQNNQASSGHQTRSYLYDMLSRLTSETNPETNNAAVTYAYDSLTSDASCGSITSAGNLLKRLDAAGNASCSSGYDALHRVGAVTYPSSSTPTKHFVYDTATVNGTAMANANTRLAEAYTCTGGCSSKITDLGFSYRSTGQASDVYELTPHSGTNYYFHVTETPWPNGAVNTISNLVGLPTITYGADGEGRASSVSASSGQGPASSVSYNAASQVTALTYGSSDSDSFTLDPNTGRMSQYQFSMGSSPKTDTGVLSWNPNGSLQSLVITDQINSANTQTCNYTHDALGRTASANCGTATFNQNFSYDPFGNINKAVPTGSTGTSFQVNYDNTNLTNRITSSPYTYTSTSDPNAKTGNLTADIWHGYGWDTANRLTSVDSGQSSGVCATYDAMDRVVEQDTGSACATSPTSTTEIVYSPSGAKLALMNGSTLSKAFVGLPGGAQAVYNGSGLLFYRHPDWLGSSRLATTPSRTCYWDIAYAPFGENYAPPTTGCVAQDLNFTGQNQDTESSTSSGGQGGLYDFMFRRHSSVQGRWLSPDPSGMASANPSDPQTWNRYAYVANRATNTTDALGLYGVGGCDDSGSPFGCGGCDPEWGCVCDPTGTNCGGCDPVDPYCGGPSCDQGCGPGPLPGPPELPGQPVRQGGVWADNETLGLPGGLNTNPLGVEGLLGLLPGCGSGSTPGFGFTASQGTSSQNPCITLIPVAAIALAVDEGGGSDPVSKAINESAVICDCTQVSGKIFLLGCSYDKCSCVGLLSVLGVHHPYPISVIQYCAPGQRGSAKACAAVPSLVIKITESDYEEGGIERTVLFPPFLCD